jgi:hypothetical protein
MMAFWRFTTKFHIKQLKLLKIILDFDWVRFFFPVGCVGFFKKVLVLPLESSLGC